MPTEKGTTDGTDGTDGTDKGRGEEEEASANASSPGFIILYLKSLCGMHSMKERRGNGSNASLGIDALRL